MRRRVVNIFLFSATALFFTAQVFVAQLSTSATMLRVDEASTRFALMENYASVSLAVENFSDSGIRAQIRLELLDTQGRVSAADKSDETIKAGSSAIVIPVSLVASKLTKQERSRLLWYRLRYRIIPKTTVGISSEPIEGIISLSEITPDLFDLEIIGSSLAFDGMRYRARARAKHPISSLAVKDVFVQAELSFDDAPSVGIIKTSATTDSDGFAVLDLDLPRNITSREAEITVTATRGGYTQEARSEIRFDRFAEMFISVDKPIYQPGQLLHMRLLARDNLLRRAVADAPVSVSISDPESTNVFRSSLKTSKYGIASLDWPIPENTRLGEYMIKVEIEEGKYKRSIAGQYVKVSRYDLPNFVVTVKPDRPYYLPGQNASVEVRADYIFGQAVTRGQVRVVRESGREWNYREQKWEVNQTDEYKGETDKTGRFIARIKLEEAHEELADSDYYRFRDATYAAYFTDPTTNRTEQRRFDLRVTKQAIHVYVVRGNNRQARRLPLQFYVTTFYADGSPAECELAITESSEHVAQTNKRPLARLKTSRYGVAKVSNLIIAPKSDDSGEVPELIFSARDGRGLSGSHDEHFYYYESRVIRVDTDKTIHKPGEPIRAEITASEPDMAVICDAVSDNRVVRSEIVRLRNGRGFINFPYNDDFKDEVVIAAYLLGDSDSLRVGSRTVLYPRDHDLKINVEPGQATYQPGEDAKAMISVTSPDGRGIESVLGVVVIDRAVEERARTDQEFGAGSGFYTAFLSDDGLAGVSRKDLDRIDLSKPQPPELDLVAEIMLNQSGRYYPDTFGSETRETNQRVLFAGTVEPQFKPVADALNKFYTSRALYPADETALRRLLADSGIDLDGLRDPWGERYRAVFSVESAMDTLSFESAGADKRFSTADDFVATKSRWPYFTSVGEAIDRAVARYHARTDGFIRDATTLKSEMRREAVELDALRDRWGNPYRFEFGVSRTRLTLNVRSNGPDASRAWDDFTIWMSQIDYVAETKDKITAALNNYFQSTARFPQNQKELNEALKGSGVDLNSLRDPWGNRYYATFNTDSRYTDRVSLRTQSIYGSEPQHRTEVTPVTQQLRYIVLRSSGPDGRQGTYDDFDAGYFFRIVAEQSAQEPASQPRRAPVSYSSSTGTITGAVTDAIGAVIPGVKVKATHMAMLLVYETKSNDEGGYILSNLPTGLYQLYFESPNFKAAVFTDVPVKSSSITQIDAALEPGGVTETVTVAAGGEEGTRETSNFSTSEKGATRSPRADARMKAQILTPRLREHFPETLLWQPEIETDSKGRAQLRFKLADNITTWKMSVIASTTDGQIGVAEREIRAFQPFFIEHDPPRVLTEGDEIALPIVVRNYLDRAQPVTLEIKPENWFALTGPARKQAQVAAGDARRETFGLRALATVKDGKQRITAVGAEASDAVEKPVTVHPDGQEITETASRLFNESTTLEINIPASAIKNSAQSELKIYPNLMTHVIESIEAILQRPYGCAEQTISSTYPSLLVLGYYKRNGEDFPPLAQTARRYAQSGYERLLGYRGESGGFSYWGRGEADLALTAYALRFLNDASEFIEVDKDVIKGAREWIIKQQQKDGSWPAPSRTVGKDSRQTAMVTSFIARVLAASKTATDDTSHQTERQAALKRALDYLARPVAEVDEPYLIASYAIAAADAGEQARAESALARLRALARNDAGMIYWALESNTPFYGWGLAGRIETTALAVQALARDCKAQTGGCRQMIDGGLLFLLRQKDRYGVWYSTQATINVLDALVTLLPKEKLDIRSAAPDPAEIFVNGRSAGSLALPPADKPSGAVTVSISGLLSTGNNLIEVRRRSGSSSATAQAVTSYYVPWTDASVNDGAGRKGGLRLGVRFDKTAARVGDEVTCKVEAERVGFSGYGMMLAEIGLPPGAEVDRASLDRALNSAGWDLSQYDVLPDRVIVYLWPRAGGTRFEFKFRPRFGLAAKSAPSLLFDYYNPEASAVVAPAKFIISER